MLWAWVIFRSIVKPHIPAAPKIHQHYHRGLGSVSSPWLAGVSLTLALHQNFGAKATKSLPQMGQRGPEVFGTTSSHGWGRVWLVGTEVTAAWAEVPSHAGQGHLSSVSLNCCRQSTRYYGTLKEGRVNKAAEGKEARISSKHPMLQNSENNGLERFQKQSLLRASAKFAWIL